MKKLLSVLLSISMALSYISFVSLADETAPLAEDPYVYVDELDGQPVVYYSSSGTYTGDAASVTNSSKAYSDFPTAVARLDAIGGGTVVMMNDIWIGSFPVHNNTIKLRGRPEKRVTITFSSQMAVGSVWFQEHLKLVSSGDASDKGPMFDGKPGYFGMPGGDDDDIIWGPGIAPVGGFDKGEYNEVSLTFYSGTGPDKIRLLGAFGGTSTTGDATFNFYGGDYTNTVLVPEHSNGWGARTNRVGGDYVFNIYGGKFKNVNFGETTSPNQLYVSGNMYLNLYGGEFEGSITPYSGTFKLDGPTSKLIVDVSNNPELLSQMDTSKVNGIIANNVECSGETILNALADVKAGTTSSVEYSGNIIAVGDGIIVSKDTTEIAHGIKVRYTGTRLVLGKGVTYTLSGDADLDDITIVARDGAVIDAGSYKLRVSDTVKLEGKLEIKGTNVSVSENDDNYTVYADELSETEGNSGIVIPMDSFEIFKADSDIRISPDNMSEFKNGALFYYVTSKGTANKVTVAESTRLYSKGNPDEAIAINELSVNKWDAITFNTEDFTSDIMFKSPVLPEGYNFYIGCIVYSPTASGYMQDFGAVVTDKFGEVIYPLDDIVIGGIDWYSRGIASGITLEEKTFVFGETTMLYPRSAAGEKSVTLRLSKTIKPEWQPYVKVEYYFHDYDNLLPDDTRMLIRCGNNPVISAETTVTANVAGGVATFEIPEDFEPFKEITLYPYGENTSIFYENNKVYMLDAVISDTKTTNGASYRVPTLGADGLILPYSYSPANGLPAVYVDTNGTYTGDYKGSVNSTVAYSTIDEAIAALDGRDGYIILCNDANYLKTIKEISQGGKYIINTEVGSFPVHENNIIIRGRDDIENKEEKVSLMLGGYVYTNGNIAFENLNICFYNLSDIVLNSKGARLTLGSEKPLFDYDVEFITSTEEKYKITYKTDHLEGEVYPTMPKTVSGNLVLNSAKIENVFLSNWAATYEYDFLSYEINAGTLNGIVPGWVGQGKAIVHGDAVITINGGKPAKTFTPFGVSANNIGGVTIEGDFTIAINGGDLSAYSNNSITLENSLVTVNGNKILDLSGYDGDVSAALSKINTAGFDILNINKIYVSDDGDDANNGTSSQTAVKTIERAIQLSNYEKDGVSYRGTVYVSGSGLTISENTEIFAHGLPVTVSSSGNARLKLSDGSLILGGETVFKNIDIELRNADTSIIANGNKVTFAEGVSVTPFAGSYLNVYGGTPDGSVDSAEIIIESGKFGNVLTGDTVNGSVSITINGGTVYGTIMGGSSKQCGVVSGDANITVNGGKILGTIIGGSSVSETAINGSVGIAINGGELGAESAIIAGSTELNAVIGGNAEIIITAGDFERMKDEAIKPGLGIYGKSWIDYMEYNGTILTLKRKVTPGFTVVIEPKNPAPTFTAADKIIHILEHIGDPTKALVARNGVKTNENLSIQKEKPIVVSPKQLNLPMEGTDHAFLTVGKIRDKKTEVIRLVPNKSPKTGAGIILDGYNIKGRGVDLTRYKYAEVIYYYSVPEGQNQIATEMLINPLGSYGAMGILRSSEIVANKWASVIFDLGTVALEKGLSGELSQYHLYPYGGKKGYDLPAEQTMHILSLTFYSDRPVTTIPEAAFPVIVDDNAGDSASNKGAEVKKVVRANILGLNTAIDDNESFVGEFNPTNQLVITPTEAEADLVIEGYGVIENTSDSKGGIINTNDLRYAKLRYYYGSESTSAFGAPKLGVYRSGITGDAAAVIPSTFEAETKKDKIAPNQWNEVIFDIAPEDPAKNKTMHIRLYPFGEAKANEIPRGDYVIIDSLEFSNTKPTTAKVDLSESALSESDFEYAEPIRVKLDYLRNAYENSNAFGARITVFDGKEALLITPTGAELEIAIDGSSAVRENDGTVSFKNYRYLEIKYYFEGDSSEEYTPSVLMKSLRGLKSNKHAIGEALFTSDDKLTGGEWKTIYIPLYGTQSNFLSRGFVLYPFGNKSGKTVGKGSKLYIQSVAFVYDVEGETETA